MIVTIHDATIFSSSMFDDYYLEIGFILPVRVAKSVGGIA